MNVPAGKKHGSRIKWYDDGPSVRVDRIAFKDGSPYKALALAAILGALSVIAVVGVIQFQRHADWSMEASLVETAQATPGVSEASSNGVDAVSLVPQSAAKDDGTAAAFSELHAAASTMQSARATPARVQAVEPRNGDVVPTSAPLSDPLPVEPTDVAPLRKDNPRWQAPEAGSATSTPAEEPPAGSKDTLAFAPAETAKAIPMPAPRPRQASTATTATEADAERPQTVAVVASGHSTNARVRGSVFLRSRPADGAHVLLTIPAGADVEVDAGCRHWCAVTYDGNRGFVYKKFLDR